MPFPLLIPLAAAAGGALLGGTGALGGKGGWGSALQGGLLGGALGFGGAALGGAGAAGTAGGGAGLLAPVTGAGTGSALSAGIGAGGGGAGLLGGLGGASSVGAANSGLMNALGPGMKAFSALQGLGGQQGQPQMISTPPLQHITQNSPYMNLMPPQFQQPQQSLQVPTSYVPYG